MCFAPQRHALFRHRNFQKWSEREVFLAFSLANVLRATTACTFSTSQLQKVLWTFFIFAFSQFFTCKCASRHNGVQLFMKSLEKHSVSRLSYPFAHLHLLSSDSFSSLIFSLLLFYSSLLSDSSHLCFSSVHIVRSLTSKLPDNL